MRADRLLSLLMLLQNRGRMTAQNLALQLEVSERTIYRDVEALSFIGVPVYCERGPGGGIDLLEDYRTNLTGLTKDEVRALFMLSIPAPLAELGVGQELQAALLKLSAALPEARRGDELQVRQRIHIDSVWWDHPEESVPFLHTVQQAVWEDRMVHLTLTLHWVPEVGIERLVAPYGLVAKAGVWYLVWEGEGRLGAYRLSELADVSLSDQTFQRPRDFNLAEFWSEWCAEEKDRRSIFPVTVRIAPNFIPHLPNLFGNRIRAAIANAAPPDDEGWITLTLPFSSLGAARSRLLGFGRAVEILEPLALRLSVQDYAEQITSLYGI